jgi:predicted enzyme related to lactoylglutathione lyase
MLRGLTTVNYLADDVAAAVGWYTELLGVEPYFSRSVEGTTAYAEFRIGDYQHELGILDRRFAASGRPGQIGGTVVYWHVDDVQASFGRLLALGATACVITRQSSRRCVSDGSTACTAGAMRTARNSGSPRARRAAGGAG